MALSHRAVTKIQWNNCVNNIKAKIINYCFKFFHNTSSLSCFVLPS